MNPQLLAADLKAQLVPGSFAHSVRHLVDALDLLAFAARHRNGDIAEPSRAPGDAAARRRLEFAVALA
jgi:hypothetical protein